MSTCAQCSIICANECDILTQFGYLVALFLTYSKVLPSLPIILCAWHVVEAWKKNLMQKVSDKMAPQRVAAYDALCDVMYTCTDHQGEGMEDAMQQKLVNVYAVFEPVIPEFIEYFKKEWQNSGKLGKLGILMRYLIWLKYMIKTENA